MLSLLAGLKQTQTESVLGLQRALISPHKSVTKLLQTNIIHQHYLSLGGRNGPLGYPNDEVRFASDAAIREYRGGQLHVLGDTVQPELDRLEVSIRFLGARCINESVHDQDSPHDEPYFIISVDPGNGAPVVKKYGPFENVDSGTEIGVGELLFDKFPPNPMSIRVVAYENDDGDPDKTAKSIQDEVVKLSDQAKSLSSSADAADGPGAGPAAAAGTVGAIAAGPLGALVAGGIVSVLGLGDDYVGQSMALLFPRPENEGTRPPMGQFQGADFNQKINVNGGEQGEYDLFFDVFVKRVPAIHTAPGGLVP